MARGNSRNHTEPHLHLIRQSRRSIGFSTYFPHFSFSSCSTQGSRLAVNASKILCFAKQTHWKKGNSFPRLSSPPLLPLFLICDWSKNSFTFALHNLALDPVTHSQKPRPDPDPLWRRERQHEAPDAEHSHSKEVAHQAERPRVQPDKGRSSNQSSAHDIRIVHIPRCIDKPNSISWSFYEPLATLIRTIEQDD